MYPAGRLDYDSEGLVFLTDDGPMQARVSEPRFHLPKTYWVQVEGVPQQEAIDRLMRRCAPAGWKRARPLEAHRIDEPPALWPRDPPIRYRARIPTSWLELVIDEGRNRQVRTDDGRGRFADVAPDPLRDRPVDAWRASRPASVRGADPR